MTEASQASLIDAAAGTRSLPRRYELPGSFANRPTEACAYEKAVSQEHRALPRRVAGFGVRGIWRGPDAPCDVPSRFVTCRTDNRGDE
jgi:hypothetical protein